MTRLAPLALLLALAACDWPVPDAIGARDTEPGPWPRLATDAELGLDDDAADAGAIDDLPEPPDLAARAAALRARAAVLAER